MSELDETRRKNFLQNLTDNQVIITCTDKIDIDKENSKVFYVEKGKIKKG